MYSKNYFSFGILFFISSCLYSQGTILGITISPSNPTIDDTITVYADLSFSNSSCELFNSSQNISGNTIQVTTQHCYGMLQTICYIVDTFTIDPLPAGSYIFDLTLTSDINYGFAPCNGGNSPNDIDTVHFEVIDPSSINTALSNKEFLLYPNPSNGFLCYEIMNDYTELIVYSIKGSEVCKQAVSGLKGEIELPIDNGFYFVKFRMKNGEESALKKILITD